MNRQDDVEPYRQDEDDGLSRWNSCLAMTQKGGCLVQTSSAICLADAQLTNARALALGGNSEAAAYELLFSFSMPDDKDQFLDLVRSDEDMGSDYTRTISSRRRLKRSKCSSARCSPD
jgi:hypothetical protein